MVLKGFVEMESFEFDRSVMNRESLERANQRTSLRVKYDQEMQVLRQQLGSLEEVRGRLGLSRRKMCQLLMVDPSAWTRWLKDESKVPPHVYRSFQWYFALIEANPKWHPLNSFQQEGVRTLEQAKEELKKHKLQTENYIDRESFKIRRDLRVFEQKLETSQIEMNQLKSSHQKEVFFYRLFSGLSLLTMALLLALKL